MRRSVLFAELNEEEAVALYRLVTFKHLAKGEMLFFEGDPATCFFILLSGRVRIYKASPDGKEYTLHHIRPGHMFAEAAIFRGDDYPANCKALEDSHVACVPKDTFISFLKRHPQVGLKIIGSLSVWLRELVKKLEDLSLKEVPARLASFLLEEMDLALSPRFELKVSKTELASRLGTIIETLSRTLRKFKEAGILEVEGKQVVIRDVERLEAIAEGEKI